MSVSIFINEINQNLKKLFESYPGSRVFGLAHSVTIKENEGAALKLWPVLLDKDGEGKGLEIDDSYPVTVYHKCNSIATTIGTGTGRGDSLGDIVNTYSNTLVIFQNRRVTRLLPDELLLYIQANFPEMLRIPPFKRVWIRFSNVILNTQLVFAAEYQNPDVLIPDHTNLIAINYTIESAFAKGCFNKCP